MSYSHRPIAGFTAFDYVHHVLHDLDLTTPSSFTPFVEHFIERFIDAQARSVLPANLAASLRPEAEAWVRAEELDGPARRSVTQARLAARSPWYLDTAEGRKQHVRAVETLNLVRRALVAAEPELDVRKPKASGLAKTIARAARVVDSRMLPVLVMVAERKQIVEDASFGAEPERLGFEINRQLLNMRGAPAVRQR